MNFNCKWRCFKNVHSRDLFFYIALKKNLPISTFISSCAVKKSQVWLFHSRICMWTERSYLKSSIVEIMAGLSTANVVFFFYKNGTKQSKKKKKKIISNYRVFFLYLKVTRNLLYHSWEAAFAHIDFVLLLWRLNRTLKTFLKKICFAAHYHSWTSPPSSYPQSNKCNGSVFFLLTE